MKCINKNQLEELKQYYKDAVKDSTKGDIFALGVRRGVFNTLEVLGIRVDWLEPAERE